MKKTPFDVGMKNEKELVTVLEVVAVVEIVGGVVEKMQMVHLICHRDLVHLWLICFRLTLLLLLVVVVVVWLVLVVVLVGCGLGWFGLCCFVCNKNIRVAT